MTFTTAVAHNFGGPDPVRRPTIRSRAICQKWTSGPRRTAPMTASLRVVLQSIGMCRPACAMMDDAADSSADVVALVGSGYLPSRSPYACHTHDGFVEAIHRRAKCAIGEGSTTPGLSPSGAARQLRTSVCDSVTMWLALDRNARFS